MDLLSLIAGLVIGFVVGSYTMLTRHIRAIDDAFDQIDAEIDAGLDR